MIQITLFGKGAIFRQAIVTMKNLEYNPFSPNPAA